MTPTLLIIAAAALGMAAYGPIEQPAGYHEFADQSTLWGVPHAGDVLSNAGFALVAGWAATVLWPRRREPAMREGWPGYGLFLAALAATAIGSTFYHLAPDDARLVWDRLPIALACAGLLAAVHAERGSAERACRLRLARAVFDRPPSGRGPGRPSWLMWGYVAAAVSSVAWWRMTDLRGTGDLRPYLLLQGLPLVLIPLWQWSSARPLQERRAFGIAVLLYVAAKGFELADSVVYDAVAPLSGHTLKHVLAALAAAAIIRGLSNRVADDIRPPARRVARVPAALRRHLATPRRETDPGAYPPRVSSRPAR